MGRRTQEEEFLKWMDLDVTKGVIEDAIDDALIKYNVKLDVRALLDQGDDSRGI